MLKEKAKHDKHLVGQPNEDPSTLTWGEFRFYKIECAKQRILLEESLAAMKVT